MSAGKKYPKPASFVIGLLSHEANSREDLKREMERKGYAAPTISSQFYNLNHWDGCIVEKSSEGMSYRLNPDYAVPEKKPKEKKAKATKGTAVPKPSKKKKKQAA